MDKGAPMTRSFFPLIAYVGTSVALRVFCKKKASSGLNSARILTSKCCGGVGFVDAVMCTLFCWGVGGFGTLMSSASPFSCMYENMSIVLFLLKPLSCFIQEALSTCDNVEIRYCAREPHVTNQHASRHRRGSLHSPSPTSPEVEVGACTDPSSPAKAFVKINNNPTNDWKVYYTGESGIFPEMHWRVDHVQESRPMTGFAFGLADAGIITDAANRDRPLR